MSSWYSSGILMNRKASFDLGNTWKEKNELIINVFSFVVICLKILLLLLLF